MDKPPPQTWRELLLEIITHAPKERDRAAAFLNVAPYTIDRWASGKVTPRPENLQRLPGAFPDYREAFEQLIEAEQRPEITVALSSASGLKIPLEYVLHSLHAYTAVRDPDSIWSMRKEVLENLLQHICGREALGLDLSIVSCLPPGRDDQPVRSLCEIFGLGTSPWQETFSPRLLFLGRESLAGWVVEKGEPGFIQDMREPGLLPFRKGSHEQSAAAYPIQREGNIAGCLLVVSSSPNIWTKIRLSYVEVYSWLAALSFRDQEFYPRSRIRLRQIPPLEDSAVRALSIAFGERVSRLRHERPSLSLEEAERRSLLQMEAELLQEG
jgi:hypothetical protein